ncbi:MAG: 50S ribosome-binding GTPase [Planctomycetes bacterium]|nr:50S ribosome-binding GTPase [Planctomycetota bacterium]
MSSQQPTVVVQLTPAGRGAVASCLVAGPNAIGLLAPLLRLRNDRSLETLHPGRVVVGQWRGSHPEEVVVTRRGTDEVSIHCHGGRVAIATIMSDLADAGGQVVEWRQWLGHSMADDPLAAEAVIALAQARTERCAGILLDQFHGALRNELQKLIQLLEHGEAEEAKTRLLELLKWSPLGLHLAAPWQVVICGAPNVGKSSLINVLVGYGRAIVAPQPGTTRDVVSASTAIDGWPIELSDTAGIRAAADPLEAAGIDAGRQRLATADVRLLVFDRSAAFGSDEQGLAADWPDAMIVHNKSDLPPHTDARPAGISVSALTGEGIDKLLEAITIRLVPTVPPPQSPVPFTSRQVEGIAAAAEQVQRKEMNRASEILMRLISLDCRRSKEH